MTIGKEIIVWSIIIAAIVGGIYHTYAGNGCADPIIIEGELAGC